MLRTERVAYPETHRERMPSAESILVRRICEVHPGADPVKEVAGYVWHTLHVMSERRDSFIRVEPRK